MKVYLMHPDRDFERQGYKEQRYPYRYVLSLPPAKAALIEDLELETLLNAMAQGDEFLYDVAKQALVSSLESPEAIRYRQAILKDCLKNPAVVREIYHIPIEAADRKLKHWMGIFTRYPSGVLSSAVQMLEMFVALLRQLKQIADEHAGEFEAEGFRRFFAMIQQELTPEYFNEVDQHLKTLKFPHGVLISAQLGNGNEGTNYVLCKTNDGARRWMKRVFSRKSPSTPTPSIPAMTRARGHWAS